MMIRLISGKVAVRWWVGSLRILKKARLAKPDELVHG
jgi:hypothetical protein